MKQACLDLSNAAIALFDLIEEKGDMAPLDSLDDLPTLMKVINEANHIRDYYNRRNIQRMLALGVSPDHLMKMVGK